MSFLSDLKNAFMIKPTSSIARRLLLYIITFSSLVTLIATSIQLYLDYRRDVSIIHYRLQDIESSYLSSLGASLWNLDTRQLELQVDGIMHLPDIQRVEVRELSDAELSPLQVIRGEHARRTLHRELPVYHTLPEGNRQVGVLLVEASLESVYQHLWEKAIVIFFTQGIKTFLVSLFILYIFYYLVTRHIIDLSQFLKKLDTEELSKKLQLNRKPRTKRDELDDLVIAFNLMTDNLVQSYDRLRQANQALEIDIKARIAAEAEVVRLNSLLEQRVIQRTAELEAANKELGAFSYSVSHDLRAPLRRIEGFRRMLIEEYGGLIDTKGHHYLSRMEVGTREMAEMIDSFLRLSRATQGELDVKDENLSLMAVEIIQQLRERDPERQIECVIQDDVTGDVDRRLFDVMLRNLLDNAWKYSRKNPQARIEFGRLLNQGEWVYYVKDNGVGFDMIYASRLFTPFTRLHQVDQFEGMGIGLTTVQRIVVRHGGRIWAEAKPNQGATFYFTLWSRNSINGDGNHSAG